MMRNLRWAEDEESNALVDVRHGSPRSARVYSTAWLTMSVV